MNSHNNGRTTAAVGELCELVNGRAFKPTEWGSEGLPIIRIQNLNDKSKDFNYFDGNYSPKHEVNDGDLLFSWSGTPGTSFGAFFWNRGRGVLNQHIFNVHIDRARVDKRYFRYALNDRLNEIIHHAHGGVGLQHITKGKLEAVAILLPPLSEQKRIADILDKADAIRCKRQEAVVQWDHILRSAYISTFGDPVANPQGLPVAEIGDIADMVTGFAFKSADYVDEGIRLCRGANVLPDGIDWSDVRFWKVDDASIDPRLHLAKDDVVIAMDRPWISTGLKVAQLAESDLPSYLVQRVSRLRGNGNVSNAFLFYTLRHPAFTVHCGGLKTETTVPHISTHDIRSFRVPVAPKAVHEKFERIAQQAKHASNKLELASNEANDLFNSLVQRAFKGEL
jgi:type I restriction enzyme S subunit